jgi:D-beta-D-heptose 7-phosphate kinase/D-beta-D-heptose 1-phosphate adenosyltransferase
MPPVNCSNKELDTRQKILSARNAAAVIHQNDKLTVLIGHFDPLTAAHARRIADIRKTRSQLVAIVTDPPQPILKLSARTELVAALEAIDYVIPVQDNTATEIVAGLRPDEVIQEEAADLDRTRVLIAHVHRRQIAKEA